MLTLLACLATLSCRDVLESERLDQPVISVSQTLATLDCVVDVAGGSVTCSPPHPGAGGARLDLTLGSTQVKMVSTNLVSDTVAELFAFDATAQNLLAEPIGTPDRFTVTGLKVFFHSGPTVTSYKVAGDTSKVTVANADSTGSFTGPNQPYHFYDQMLQPQEVSAKKRWEFRVPRTVARFSFSVKVLAAAPSETPVPVTSPDFEPSWIHAPENWLPDIPCGGRSVANVLLVEFRAATSQEERQVAIDLIGGTVVGGLYGGPSGVYYVQIARDSSGVTLCRAEETLLNLPTVEFASIIPEPAGTLYQKPKDGSGFDQWQLDSAQADSANWALEAIAAPLGWGCETGRDDLAVAIVDKNHIRATDLWHNATHIDSAGLFLGTPANMHGTRVGAIAAAQGNNRSGMTGVMWDADLRLYDVRRQSNGPNLIDHPQGQARRVVEAARAGAKVINLSFGYTWHERTTRLPLSVPAETADDRRLMQRYRRIMGDAVQRMQDTDALLVIGAGNTPVDAYWSGYAQVQADYPDRVIVVAASNRNSRLWTQDANFGSGRNIEHSFVEVAAPGENVYTFTSSTPVTDSSSLDLLGLGSGTSLAAPHVTGLAGLLRSFDSRLTAAETKRLILLGAQRGAKTAGGIPVINVHESLKAAAERPGAPLCGNRVWNRNGVLVAQRGNEATSPVESLFSAGATADWIQPLHGGKRIWLWGSNGGDEMYRWIGGGWSQWVSPPDSVFYADYGPTFRSYYGESHDRDTVAYMTQSGGSLVINLYDAQDNHLRTLAPITVPSSGTASHACVRRAKQENAEGRLTTTCHDSVAIVSATSSNPASLAYPLHGDAILVGTSGNTFNRSLSGSWYSCPNQPAPNPDPEVLNTSYDCRDYAESGSPTGGLIYPVSVRTGAVGTPLALGNVRIDELAFADGRAEVLVRVETENAWSATYAWSGPNRADLTETSRTGGTSTSCETQFRSSASLATVLHRVPVCGAQTVTFSPNRVPATTLNSRGRSVPAPYSAVPASPHPQGRWWERVRRHRSATMRGGLFPPVSRPRR